MEEDRAHRHELQEGKPWSGANPVVSTHEHNSIRLVQCGKLVGWQGRKRSSNAEKTIFRMSKVRAKSCSTMEKFAAVGTHAIERIVLDNRLILMFLSGVHGKSPFGIK